MSWTEMDRNIATLEASTIWQIYDNIEFIKQQLDLRYQIYGEPPQVDTLIVPDADYDTPVAQVKAELEKIESDLDKLCASCESIYWKEHKTIYSHFILADYQRWVDILNEYKNRILPENRGWAILELSDGLPTFEDGKYVAIRGEHFGQHTS